MMPTCVSPSRAINSILWILTFCLLAVPAYPAAQKRQEEKQDYFKKWLEEDVLYIITPEERSVFLKLSTAEEKEQFIEQFWFRRDPDPLTAGNDFKEEHYRRIAYTNERFSSGLPGWMSDRGRIYIVHGPPAEIESHPTGGNYQRPMHEGGGSTSTYPFEVWRYRYIEGIGNDVVLEFVDRTMSGEYRLALQPEEKDALLHVPGAGLTTAESMGLASKQDRPYFSPGNRNYPFQVMRARDSAFERYEVYSRVQRPTELRYKDLKGLVDVDITFDNLPYELRKDYFRLNEQQILVPLTIELQNKDLTFAETQGGRMAKVAVYGIVSSLSNRIVSEFEDEMIATLSTDAGFSGRSLYQKILFLENRGRYKLDLVVKDLNSSHVGVIRQAIVPPRYGEEELSASSVILSDFLRQLSEVPKEDRMFVLGDVWVRPSLSKTFLADGPFNVYLQIYNTGIDQTTLNPALSVTYRILGSDGATLFESSETSGESVQLASGLRVVLVKQLSLASLSPGDYDLQIEVTDRIKDESLRLRESFKVVASSSAG